MSITTLPNLINSAFNLAQPIHFKRRPFASTAGLLYSSWRNSASPLDGAIPTAMAACDNTTVGALPFTNPSGDNKTYLFNISLTSASSKTILTVDRLCASGGLDGTLNTSQPVDTLVPSRGVSSNFDNLEWFLEWYIATGSSAVTATVTYTNHLDVTGKTTIVAIGASTQSNRLLEIIPLSGDFIKSIQSVQLSATTGTQGNFGVSCYRRFTSGNQDNPQFAKNFDFAQLAAPEIPNSACLSTIEIGQGNTSSVSGTVTLIQG